MRNTNKKTKDDGSGNGKLVGEIGFKVELVGEDLFIKAGVMFNVNDKHKMAHTIAKVFSESEEVVEIFRKALEIYARELAGNTLEKLLSDLDDDGIKPPQHPMCKTSEKNGQIKLRKPKFSFDGVNDIINGRL